MWGLLLLYELDLHRYTVNEALFKCDIFLREASQAGLYRVSIIHGKGTGTLRDAVRNHLSHHPLVREIRRGGKDEGGEGVTIVELRTR
jgi:DNA mismatch repair protein MutS2